MSQISSLSGALSGQRNEPSGAGSLNELDIDHFLTLMITELQNQDPLNPLENHELLQQISQIREVGATDKLTNTLEAVLLGQNISSATNLIGQDVRAITDAGNSVSGIVEQVTIIDGVPRLELQSAFSTTEASSESGDIEAGTYLYKVLFAGEDGQSPFAVELGPLTTTGRMSFDQSIVLNNLPETLGRKLIYRTDKTGQGGYHLINEISGSAATFTDGTADKDLPNSVLEGTTQSHPGGRTAVVSLRNVAEVRRPADEDNESL